MVYRHALLAFAAAAIAFAVACNGTGNRHEPAAAPPPEPRVTTTPDAEPTNVDAAPADSDPTFGLDIHPSKDPYAPGNQPPVKRLGRLELPRTPDEAAKLVFKVLRVQQFRRLGDLADEKPILFTLRRGKKRLPPKRVQTVDRDKLFRFLIYEGGGSFVEAVSIDLYEKHFRPMKGDRISYVREWATATFIFKRKKGRLVLVAIDGTMPD